MKDEPSKPSMAAGVQVGQTSAKQSTNPFDSSSTGGVTANQQAKDAVSPFVHLLEKITDGPNRSWDFCIEGGIREMIQREKKHPDKNGGYSKTIQLEVRLENRGPVTNNDGDESSLKVIPSKYIIKRKELRSQIEMRKRYRLYFRLMKDAYGKAHVIDLDRIDADPKVAAELKAEKRDGPDELGPDEQHHTDSGQVDLSELI